jgi:serine/threonine-protein kinase
MALAAGQLLKRYRIHSLLGTGGMGEVYRAHDPRLDRWVAIKIIKGTADSLAAGDLVQEARAASALNHPNVCTVYEVDEADGQTFIVMELVDGRPLAAAIGARGMAVEQVVRYAIQIASALAHAHARGVVHRDLKSANVMIAGDVGAKVLDFGIARRHTRADVDATTRAARPQQRDNDFAGTLAYMAPECLQGAVADERSDIWSLGILIYEMLTGQQPFRGRTSFEVTSAILRDSAPPLPPHVPQGLQNIVRRCLQKEPSDRYQRSGEVVAALDAAALQTPFKPSDTPRSRKALLYGVLAAVMVLTLGSSGWYVWTRNRTVTAPIQSLAVLPFTDLSSTEPFYLADGLTDAVITELGQLGALSVTSRTSSMRYRTMQKSIPEIARELAVDAVVEGSIVREGSRVRVSAQLIRAATDSSLWSGSYERDVKDILGLQRDIARNVAEELRVRLTPQQASRFAAHPAVRREAVEAYLKGRYHWNKRTIPALQTSVSLFEEAIRLDPGYAAPYAGLAGSYVLLSNTSFSTRPSKELLPRAKAAAARALELDGELAEAHTALAYALLWSWDLDGSERAFQRALGLNPNDATTRFWHAIRLAAGGRFDDAMAEATRGQQLDPASAIVTAGVSWVSHLAGRHAQAEQQARAVLAIEPEFPIGFARLGAAHRHQRHYPQAVSALERAVQLSQRQPDHLAQLGQTYALMGEKRMAQQILDELQTQAHERYVPAFDLVLVYAGLGEHDAAFAALDHAFEEQYGLLALLSVEPDLDALRADPRFAEMVRKVTAAVRDGR